MTTSAPLETRRLTPPYPSQQKFTLAVVPRALTPLDPATVTLSVLVPVYKELNTI